MLRYARHLFILFEYLYFAFLCWCCGFDMLHSIYFDFIARTDLVVLNVCRYMHFIGGNIATIQSNIITKQTKTIVFLIPYP